MFEPRLKTKRSARRTWCRRLVLWVSPVLFALAGSLIPNQKTEAGIEILESDTLRTTRSERNRATRDARDEEKGFRITIQTDEDTLESKFRFGPPEHRSSRWVHVDGSGEDIVRFGEDIVVDVDELIDGSVVSMGGDVIVRGRVTEDVVSLGGSVTLEDGSVVEGDAVAIGGKLDRQRGARLDGENVGLRFIPGEYGPFGSPDGHVFFIVLTAISVGFLWICGVLFEWLMPLRMRNMAEQVRIKLWPSFFAGLAVHLLFLPVFALLLVTVIGIPLAILLPFVFALIITVGTIIVTALLGARLWGNATLRSRVEWIRGLSLGLIVLSGFSIVALVFAGMSGIIGTFGGLFLMSTCAGLWTLSTIGIGAVALSRFGGKAPFDVPSPPISGGASDPDPFGTPERATPV